MKRIISKWRMLPLGIMMVLMGILGMKGAHAQCLDSVPWGTPLSFENSCCWTVAPGSDWSRYADFDQIVSDGNSSADHRILSPWVQIPASAQQDSLALMYLTGSTCREDYSVCVTTDGVHFDTLFRGRTPDEAFYYDDTLYIGAYAGQWVRFELCHYVLNSIYEPDSACWSIFTTRQLLFQNIRLESPMPPVAWMSVPEKAYVGENTLFSASLFSGSHTGLTYTWHSSLMGQTFTGDSVTMIYTAAGMDTVTMVATNAFGNDTLMSEVQVFDCRGVIAANPWMVNFETDYDCWRTVGDYGWTKYYYNSNPGIAGSGNDYSMIASPAVALPADSTGLRLYWKDRRLSSATTYYVMVSRSGRFDLDDYDTLYTSTMQNTSLTQRSVSLADYAGDTVYIAFRQLYQSGRRVFVTNVKMYNSLAPIATLEAPTTAVATGDTVRYTVNPSQGDSLTYSWHSALLDSTIVTLDSVLSIVYPFAGPEALIVTVSNAHGALSLETSLGVFDCDTISAFPWEEEFMAMNADAAYTVCWEISDWDRLASNYSYGCEDEDGNHETMDDVMVCNTANNYMVLPPVRVPETEAERLKVWVKYIGRMLVTISTDGGQTYPDTAYFDNVNNHYSKLRAVSLAPYAGQTVHVRLSSTVTSSYVDRVAVDYDTTPRVDITAPTKTVTDTPTLCVATLRYGDTVGLVYTWHSQVGGTFVTNAAGDSAWVTYSAGITGSVDYVSVVATNAYGSDSAQCAIHVKDCTPQTTLPWRETFAEGTVCWYKPEGSKFYDAIPYGNSAYERLRHLYLNTQKDTLGSWIMSKAIEIPADTDMGVTLFWKVASSANYYHHLYSVLATTADDYTDTANYTVLYTDSSTHINFSNYDTRSVSLAQYAGQTVHVAIHNHGHHNVPGGIGLYFDDIEVRSTQVPIVRVTADASTYYYGDTARFTATLQEGSTNGITYTWHSTMLDSTVTINSNLFTLNYTQSGVDTVTVIATNAYGSDTASVIVNSTIITQPQVALQHTEANVGEPTVFTAVLNRCVTEGLTYTWHSTLLDTTVTLNYNLLSINYPSTGVDTVSVIATNIYGSDTAVVVVSVQNCSPRVLPYYENFEGIVATAAETAGNLPDCWNYFWNGSNAAYAPHVITTGGYQYISDLTDNALLFVAGSYTGYGSDAMVFLPRFADSLQHLALALDYRFESSSRGNLTVGWYDSNEMFHIVKILTPHAIDYVRDTVLFTDHIAANYRIALWWNYGSSWYAAVVDNIEVYVDNTIHAPANLAVDNIGAHSARVTWAAVDSASAYHVQINGVLDTTVSGLACNLTSLSPHTQYTVHVAAIVGTETGRSASTTFTTLCGAVSLPYSNDFSQGESSVECWTSSNLNQFYQSGYMIIWSGLSTKPSYQTTPIVAHPGNQMVVSFRARKYGTSTTESGRLIVGAMTNPADTTTFTAIDTFMTTSAWSEYRFSTRNLDTMPVAIAFCVGTGDGEYCNVAIDDLSIEVSIDCATLLTAEAVVQDARSVELSWQYDNYGRLDPEGVLIDLYDLTSGVNTAFVAHGTDTTLVFPFLYHSYHAELQVLCGSDTSEALSLDWAPDPCTAPEASASADTHSIVLSWQRLGSENLWVVEYRAVGSATWDTAGSTDSTSFTIAGLTQATHYEVRVGSLCIEGDTLYGNTLSVTTLCGRFGLPYSHDFSTGEAGCWFVPCGIISDATSYSSGGARMDDFMAQPRPIRSPEFDRDLNGLIVRYTVNGDRFFSSMIKVGVSDADGQNPLWLDSTIAAEGTHEYSYSFENFTGTQRHIIFYGDFITYLIRVQVDSVVSCQPVSNLEVTHLSDTAATLQWSPSVWPGQWAVYLDGVLQGTTNDTTFLLDGLQSQTDYVASVSQVCSASDTSVSRSLLFSTPCQPFTLPYSMDFENEYRLDSICWRTILYPYCSYPSASINGTSSRNLFIVAVSSGYNTENYDTSYRNFACSPLIDPQGQGVDISFRASLWSFDATSFFEVGIMADVADTAGFIPLGNVTPSSSSSTYINHQFSVAAATLPQPFCLAFRFGGTLIRCYIDDISITASIPVTHELTLSVNDTAMGIVSGDGTYEEGSNITFSAIPNEGYHFVMWNDSVTIATRTVKVETDTAFTAFFAPDSTPVIPDTVWYAVTVTTDAPEACEVYGSGVYADSSTVEIGFLLADTAIEGGHWQFLGWSDGGSGNPRDILVTSDTAIVALFEWIEDSVGIDNVSTYQRINVYPNPASTDVTVSVSQPSVLTVIDLQGRVVIPPTSINSQFTILHSQLAPGTYFLRVATEEGVTVKKLIMQ